MYFFANSDCLITGMEWIITLPQRKSGNYLTVQVPFSTHPEFLLNLSRAISQIFFASGEANAGFGIKCQLIIRLVPFPVTFVSLQSSVPWEFIILSLLPGRHPPVRTRPVLS